MDLADILFALEQGDDNLGRFGADLVAGKANRGQARSDQCCDRTVIKTGQRKIIRNAQTASLALEECA